MLCPEYRRPVLAEKRVSRLEEILRQVATELETEIIAPEIAPDQAQLLGEVDPQFAFTVSSSAWKGHHLAY